MFSVGIFPIATLFHVYNVYDAELLSARGGLGRVRLTFYTIEIEYPQIVFQVTQ